jgi:hypothetical protein
MTRLLQPVLTLLCVGITLHGFAQTDTTVRPSRPAKKPVNNTKLELVYKQSFHQRYSNGRYSSYSVSHPFIRINDGDPESIDKRGTILRRYYTKAPLANEQLNLMNQHINRGRTAFWVGGAVGVVTAFSGLFAAAKDDANTSVFWTRFGIGGGILLGSGIYSHIQHKKADKALRLSIDLYNSRYYKPLPADSLLASKAASSSAPTEPSDRKYYKDTIYYSDVRNEPENSGLYGIALHVANIDMDGRNMNMGLGLEGFYTYKSLLGVSLCGYMPYLDAIKNRTDEKPYGWEMYGVPTKYQRMLRVELQTKLSVLTWEKKASYGIAVPSGIPGVAGVGNIKGKKLKAITARLGYHMENKTIENINGIPFATTTPPYTYYSAAYPDGYPLTLGETSLSASNAMMRSHIIAAGIGLSSFRNMEVWLVKQKRNDASAGQRDFYVDLLYAASISLQDIVYNHRLPEGSDAVIPQRLNLAATPMKKIGFRVGYEAINMIWRRVGTKFGIEAGMRPGPKMATSDDNSYFRLRMGLLFGGRAAQQ